jgi:hypothetical protein
MSFLKRVYPFNAEQTVNILSEFGPLVTMFVVNGATGDINAGTWALIVSTLVAMAVMRWVLGRLPVFPIIASSVTIVFGLLTIITHDPMWVQIKVSIFNALFAGFLFGVKDGYVNPELMGWHVSGEVLIIVILGGLGHLRGALIGAFAFALLQEFFKSEAIFGEFAKHWHLGLGLTIIASVALLPRGLVGVPGRTAYSASKFAMTGFFEALRAELKTAGISVTTAYPGVVATQIRHHGLNAAGQAAGSSGLKEDKAMSVEECARLILDGMDARQRDVVMSAKGKLGRWLKLLAPARVEAMALNALKDEVKPS